MKLGFPAVAAAAVLAALAAARPLPAFAVAQPTKPVDLAKYAGLWYEIARVFNKREADCVAATVNYAQDRGKITATEICRTASGGQKVYRPGVQTLDPGTNAKLRLTFFVLLHKDYWVLDHAEDYRWAIVGEPTGKYFWVFARTPDMPEPLKSEVITRAKSFGYDTTRAVIYDKP